MVTPADVQSLAEHLRLEPSHRVVLTAEVGQVRKELIGATSNRTNQLSSIAAAMQNIADGTYAEGPYGASDLVLKNWEGSRRMTH